MQRLPPPAGKQVQPYLLPQLPPVDKSVFNRLTLIPCFMLAE
jgi:hypothetical protein